MQVLQLDQYSKINNLEIRGVPNNPHEDLLALLSATGEKVESPIHRADIDIAHGVPTPGKPNTNNIIVRFVSRVKKNDFQINTNPVFKLAIADIFGVFELICV